MAKIHDNTTAFFIYSLDKGGAERMVANLLSHFTSPAPHLLVLKNRIQYSLPSHIKIKEIGFLPLENIIFKLLFLPVNCFLLWRYCKKNQINHVLSFMVYPNFINSLLSATQCSIRCSISERNTPSLLYQNPCFKSTLNKFLIRNLYPFADFILPNSCGAARDLTLTFHIPEHKVRVFHNGISFSDIQQAKNLPVYRTKPKFLFLNVARFAPQKNQLLLIEAFALCNFTPDTELWFLGDGPCEKYCKDRVSELNLHNVIHFFGRTQNPFPFYWVADTFVLPSTFEGFPNVMLEALACQCPTIATYCGTGPSEIFGIVDPHCPPEEIVETSAGWLVPQPEIHLLKTALKLARESNNLTHKSKNASQIAKHYDIKTCLATLNQHLS